MRDGRKRGDSKEADQARVELREGCPQRGRGRGRGEKEKPFAEVSPFKKLEEKMNTEQLQGFKRKLESEREERIRQQKVICFLLEYDRI